MANSPPEKRRCTKDERKGDAYETNDDEDGDNVDETKSDDIDDVLLLSQAMNESGMNDFYWFIWLLMCHLFIIFFSMLSNNVC